MFLPSVDALGRAALVVTHVLGRFVAGNPLGARLRLGCRLAAAPRVGQRVSTCFQRTSAGNHVRVRGAPTSMIGTCPSARLVSSISGASYALSIRS